MVNLYVVSACERSQKKKIEGEDRKGKAREREIKKCCYVVTRSHPYYPKVNAVNERPVREETEEGKKKKMKEGRNKKQLLDI